MDLTVKLSYLRFCTCTFSCFRDHNTVDRIDRHVKQFTVFALQCRSNVGHITDVIADVLLVEEPAKTIFFLISDLEEGGNRAALLRRLEELKHSGVTVVVLLAIADGGKPYYDAQTAQRIAGMEIPCFACAPDRLPELLERVLKKQDLAEFAARHSGKQGLAQ